MATTGLQNHPENHLKHQLAVAVRSIQWSYAIFWTTSTKNKGGLEWGAGYYNGDIKTRKTVQLQHMEISANRLGMQRSEQLRELYESLAESESNQQARRPSASLSPEDLSDAEWYYLVCMSFTFSSGQGLPGRVFSTDQPIWLCDAHCVDSKVYIRSLLAKSASIQTVVCFPFLGGVIELGVTEMVPEDLALVQHVKTVFMELKKPSCSVKSTPNGDKIGEDILATEIIHDIVDTVAALECGIQHDSYYLPRSILKEEIELRQNGVNTVIDADLIANSPSSDECESDEQAEEDSYIMNGVNVGVSQVQSWQFLGDEFEHSDGMQGSESSSDCVSQTFLNQEKSSSRLKKTNSVQGLQEFNHTKFNDLDLSTDDMHYKRTLSVIFKTSHALVTAPCSNSCYHKSSFRRWKQRGLVGYHQNKTGTPQKMLKRILFDVPLMHSGAYLKSNDGKEAENGVLKSEGHDIALGHEKREALDDKFLVLRSLVPSINKFDRTSLLSDTVDYLKELERRVEELESCREFTEFETIEKRKHPDIVERTSDNYGYNENANEAKTVLNKRKACDIDEMDPELDLVSPKDGVATYVTVCMIEKEVLVEIRCPWKDCLIIGIIDAISKLHLDAHSIQSAASEGILTLTLKSKFRGVDVVSAGMIKEAIHRVIGTC
ncbi:hypothetical protein MKX01_005055 [Papaver californicum]|nr:hypothetical protein MKX01_005055 [Papaver californicum]